MVMTQPTQTEVSQLRRTIEELTASVRELNTQMLVHNTKQEPIEQLVNKHEIQLNGDGQKLMGLVQAVAEIDKAVVRFFGNLERAVWVIVAAVLTGVGVALVEVFKAGIR